MIEIPVTRLGETVAFALVDDEDVDRVSRYKWYPDKDGYVRTSYWEGGRCVNVSLHRLVMGFRRGDPGLDHINGNRLDCQKNNLRPATQRMNGHNKRAIGTNGTSEYRGVSFDSRTQKWQATVWMDGKCHYLGQYLIEIEAAQVVATWRRQHMPDSLQEVL